MADIRCPNCGKNNPDFLDFCQFCQTPLKPESVLRIGDHPTKKNTGELESVLPEWLKDVRQQARDLAEEDAAQAAAQSKGPKNEPPDLLAGLASQSSSADEEEVPDWLKSINPTAKSKPAAPSTPAPETDFFAQFNQSKSKPAAEPPREDVPSRVGGATEQPPVPEQKDELSEWFTQAAEQPGEIVEFDSDAQLHDRTAWASDLDSSLPSPQKPTAKEPEDLSWLHNLEESAKQTGDLNPPKRDPDWTAGFERPAAPSQPSGSKEDLSWLDSLGGIDEPAQPSSEQAAAPQDDLSWLDRFSSVQDSQPGKVPEEKPASAQEDLSWLNRLGAASESQSVDAAPDQPAASQPFASEEELNWLNSLGGTSDPSQPFNAPVPNAGVPSDQPSSEEDLSWLNNLGATSEQPEASFEPAQDIPSSPQDDFPWLKDLGGEPEPLSAPPFADTGSLKEPPPRQTAPLGKKEEQEDTEPDWLKSATQAPSMPAPGDVSMDWFAQAKQPADEKTIPPAGTPPTSPPPTPFSELLATPGEPSTPSNQDVDSLFSMEMPDWLSRPEPETTQPASPQTIAPAPEGEESLAPVDLPSWVQAMRPVEAVISETALRTEDQPEEKEGPLAGLRGVIPGAPMGSSQRPKAISLKLQATDEQQAGAALLEQILGSETSPRTLVASSFIASQQVLRWVLTGLFLVVLGVVISLRSQNLPVSANLSAAGSGITNAVMSIPANAKVLVVIDYEPSLTGEMEAIAGPLLNQMVSLSHPNLSFLSTSPNGSALVERLMTSTKLSRPAPDGFGYQAGTQYCNLGYLPGGSAGVLGFIEAPGQIIASACGVANIGSFSDYAAVIVMTDHAESGRIWIEQLQNLKQTNPGFVNQPLLVIASAQAGPLLQPYVSSGQINGMISGLSEAARYEYRNNLPSGIARSYWDPFGIGLAMSIALIVVGSLWSLFTGMRARRAETEQG
ncbi:MAG TPA: hypothetical protein VK249_22850 [Anaerolineales bacterium]|nr:hypothetical protein [Anaerolineales bacterium]